MRKIARDMTPMYPKYSKYVTNMLPFRRVKYAEEDKRKGKVLGRGEGEGKREVNEME